MMSTQGNFVSCYASFKVLQERKRKRREGRKRGWKLKKKKICKSDLGDER